MDLFQHSDNKIKTKVRDKVTGDVIPPASFSNAEYILASRAGGVLIHKTLNNGITVDVAEGEFVTFIDDAAMTMRGTYEHQFVVFDLEGNKLPPVFKKTVKVRPVIKTQE